LHPYSAATVVRGFEIQANGPLGVGAIFCRGLASARAQKQASDDPERELIEDDSREETEKEYGPGRQLIHSAKHGARWERVQARRGKGALNSGQRFE
jgi:hypothetical protein